MAKKQKPNKAPTPEELGIMLRNIYESGYLDHNTAYKMSFLKGIARGLGSVIGATIVVALLLWLLSVFDSVTFVGRFVDDVKQTVDSQTP